MLIVQKFGGTSVGTVERIKHVAKLLIDSQKAENSVVAVCSAMSGETNRLVELANQINPQPWSREYDMLLASGEQIAVSLVALAINSMGGKARPILGHQLGIRTDNVYSKARIQEINTGLIHHELDRGFIPVIAGFQGVDHENNITTLGRGGSDTSAVAIAAALHADECTIFTDVDGVYSTDPRMCAKARKLDKICYEEMLELASLGAKVLQIRSVELAAKFKVPLQVCSSFSTASGTRIVEEDCSMENSVVRGIAADINDAKVSIMGLPDRPGVAYEVFGPLAEAAIVVDVIVQTSPVNGRVGVSFTVPQLELQKTVEIIENKLKLKFQELSVSTEKDLGKVSIVGVGMHNHPGVASKMFQVLADEEINIQLITTSEIKVSVLIDKTKVKTAVEKLHWAFGLDVETGELRD